MEEKPPEPKEPTPRWEKVSIVIVFAMVVAAFAYIGWGFYEQKMYAGLIADLFSGDAGRAEAAEKKLIVTDDSLPYLVDALVNDPVPRDRALAARVLYARLAERLSRAGSFASAEEQQKFLRSGLNMEGISQALLDECPEVREGALKVMEKVGPDQNYQKNRLDEMTLFEGLMRKLESAEAGDRKSATDELLEAKIRALPFLVGAVFSKDAEFRLRGLAVLRDSVQEILKGSNQRRIVTLLGRRRCGLLLREMDVLPANDRPVLTDILNISGRIPPAFFADFLKRYAPLDEAGRRALVAERILQMELDERVRGGASPESDKIKELSGKTGGGE